jgi:enoyl-CoA hydratase/carnithine racemase
MSGDDALAFLHPLLSLTAEGEEAAEGIAAFREKRRPSWSD